MNVALQRFSNPTEVSEKMSVSVGQACRLYFIMKNDYFPAIKTQNVGNWKLDVEKLYNVTIKNMS